MDYDLTLFSTIASVSSGFVAIIGGLITSKLITINSERTAVVERMAEIDELFELKLYSAEEIKIELEEDDALDFIVEHIDSLEAGKSLGEVYETDVQQRLDFEVLKIYWEKGILLFREFQNAIDDEQELNDDEIPVEIAKKITNDDFAYSLCEKFVDHSDGLRWTASQSVKPDYSWYREKNKELDQLFRELDVLKLQREQLKRQKQSLVKPQKISVGLWVFAGIIIFNILLPLLLMKVIPNYPALQNCAEILCLIFVALGFFLTFIYICLLLGWKQKGE